jgi:preprotein translocase SecE subunit
MEDKRPQIASTFSSKQAVNFFGDIKSEFKKVSWTSAEELKVYTNVVVIGTFVFGMMVYLMDLLFQNCIFGLNFILRFIMG